MKNKVLLVAISAFALMGCDPIEGLLHVDKNLKVTHDQSESVNLTPGDYPMKLNISGRKSAQIKLKTGNRDLKLNLNIAAKSIPDNGTLKLNSKQTGQPFDLQLTVKTTYHDSERRREFESCELMPNPPNCGPNGCYGGNPNPRWGSRDIEYIIRTSTKKLDANLLAPGTQDILARLDGDRVIATKIITRQGYCF